MIENPILVPSFQLIKSIQSSLAIKQVAQAVNNDGLSVAEYLSYPLYDLKTGVCLIKDQVEKWFNDFLFYHTDDITLTFLGVTKPTLSADQLLLLNANPQENLEVDQDTGVSINLVSEWYKQYSRYWVHYSLSQYADATIKLQFIQPSVDDAIQFHCLQPVFLRHHELLFKTILLQCMPQYKKYLENANTFKETVRELMLSEEYLHIYADLCIKYYASKEQQSAFINELKTKLDILDPSGKLSSEILQIIVNYSFFKRICIKTVDTTNKITYDIINQLVTKVFYGIENYETSPYKAFFKNITTEMGSVQAFQTIMVDIINRIIGREAQFKAIASKTYEVLFGEVEFVIKKPELGVPSKFMNNINLKSFMTTLVICSYGLITYYAVKNHDDFTSKTVLKGGSAYKNLFSLFLDVYKAGRSGYIQISEFLIASDDIENIIKSLETGLPNFLEPHVSTTSLPVISKLVPLLYISTLDSYLWNVNSDPLSSTVWINMINKFSLPVGFISACYCGPRTQIANLLGGAFLANTLSRTLKLKDNVTVPTIQTYIQNQNITESYFLTSADYTQRLNDYNTTKTFDANVVYTNPLSIGFTPEFFTAIRKNIDAATKTQITTKYGFKF